MNEQKTLLKGRGIAEVPPSPYEKHQLSLLHKEAIDAPLHEKVPRRKLYIARPKTILNRIKSPDIPAEYGMNPYQGCEHGCVYCYARKSHTYWGLSAGLEFETHIIMKKEAPKLLEKAFLAKSWRPTPVMLAGNTDCYQPLEKQMRITRECLKVFLRYGNPVGIITKNALITRDLDILSPLAKKGLVHVYLSLTTFDKQLRGLMEPRTSSTAKRLQTIATLSEAGVPTGVMVAPIIVGLNDHEMPSLLQISAEQGACTAGYSLLRLDDQLAPMFLKWLQEYYPAKAEKIWNKVCEMHGSNLIDKKFGRRMRGTGALARIVGQLFAASRRKWFQNRSMPAYNCSQFSFPHKPSLF